MAGVTSQVAFVVASSMLELNGVPVVFETYPNGESRLVEEKLAIDPDSQEYTLRYESDTDLIQLLILKRYLDKALTVMGLYDSDLLITHMPYARMDRAPLDKAFSLKAVCEVINSLDFRMVGVCDPHSDVCVGLLENAVEVPLIEPLLDLALKSSESGDSAILDTVFIFPDGGAQKRYEYLAIKYGVPQLIGFKHRDFNTGKIERMTILNPGAPLSPNRRTGVIIDDISSYGGTFVMAANELRGKYNLQDIYLVVSHCERSANKGDLLKTVNHVFTTDSMFHPTHPEYGLESDHITRFMQSDLMKGLD